MKIDRLDLYWGTASCSEGKA